MDLGIFLGREHAAGEIDVAHRHFRQSVDVDGLFRTGTDDIGDMDIMEIRGCFIHRHLSYRGERKGLFMDAVGKRDNCL